MAPKPSTHCKRGHPFAQPYVPGQYRNCGICEAEAQRRRRAARRTPGLVPIAMSPSSYALKKAWATRRQKYGPSGASPEGVASIISARSTLRPRKTHCKRGHPLTPRNTWVSKLGHRTCRACRGSRPEWITVTVANGPPARINLRVRDRTCRVQHRRLRARMLAAHPDKGGTAAAFRKSKDALSAFFARIAKAYAALGVTPPIRLPRVPVSHRQAA